MTLHSSASRELEAVADHLSARLAALKTAAAVIAETDADPRALQTLVVPMLDVRCSFPCYN